MRDEEEEERLEVCIRAIIHGDCTSAVAHVAALKKMLAVQVDSPIDYVLQSGVLPFLIEMIKNDE